MGDWRVGSTGSSGNLEELVGMLVRLAEGLEKLAGILEDVATGQLSSLVVKKKKNRRRW